MVCPSGPRRTHNGNSKSAKQEDRKCFADQGREHAERRYGVKLDVRSFDAGMEYGLKLALIVLKDIGQEAAAMMMEAYVTFAATLAEQNGTIIERDYD